MRRISPYLLLFILLLAVPIVVGGAGLIAFLLLRAGYGFLVWGLLPLLVSLVLAGVIGLVLGRAASGTPPDKSSPSEEPPRKGASR